jgi:hypothetical protein
MRLDERKKGMKREGSSFLKQLQQLEVVTCLENMVEVTVSWAGEKVGFGREERGRREREERCHGDREGEREGEREGRMEGGATSQSGQGLDAWGVVRCN